LATASTWRRVRSQVDWFALYQAGMLTFRAFRQGKATWISKITRGMAKGESLGEQRADERNLANSIG